MSAMRGTLRAVKAREHYCEIAVDAGRDPINGKRARRRSGVHGRKRAAARAQAKRGRTELVVKGRDGRIQRRDSYGHDRRDRKG